jgi:hypothetical protein
VFHLLIDSSGSAAALHLTSPDSGGVFFFCSSGSDIALLDFRADTNPGQIFGLPAIWQKAAKVVLDSV